MDPKELKEMLAAEVKKAAEAAKKETLGQKYPLAVGAAVTFFTLAVFKGVEVIVDIARSKDEPTPLAAAMPGMDSDSVLGF
jgi:hypothetical protein